MATVTVELDDRLIAQIHSANVAGDVSRIIALQLFRDGKVSLPRAAELCQTPLDEFKAFAFIHGDHPPDLPEADESARHERAIAYMHSLGLPTPSWLEQARQSSRTSGTISLDEINQEIAASRRERRQRLPLL